MKRKVVLFLCLAAISLPGCQLLRSDPKAELVASAEIFASTVNVLTELKAQGQLGDDEIEDVGAMIHLAQKYLEQWRTAIDAGEKDADAMTAFKMILEELGKVWSSHDVSGISDSPAPVD